MEAIDHDLASSASGDEPAGLSKKGTPWSVEEHYAFLRGLEKLGRGNWRGISRFFVSSRTPTQVASHAQKHFLRVGGNTKRRSRFSAIEEELYGNGPVVAGKAADAGPGSTAPRPTTSQVAMPGYKAAAASHTAAARSGVAPHARHQGQHPTQASQPTTATAGQPQQAPAMGWMQGNTAPPVVGGSAAANPSSAPAAGQHAGMWMQYGWPGMSVSMGPMGPVVSLPAGSAAPYQQQQQQQLHSGSGAGKQVKQESSSSPSSDTTHSSDVVEGIPCLPSGMMMPPFGAGAAWYGMPGAYMLHAGYQGAMFPQMQATGPHAVAGIPMCGFPAAAMGMDATTRVSPASSTSTSTHPATSSGVVQPEEEDEGHAMATHEEYHAGSVACTKSPRVSHVASFTDGCCALLAAAEAAEAAEAADAAAQAAAATTTAVPRTSTESLPSSRPTILYTHLPSAMPLATGGVFQAKPEHLAYAHGSSSIISGKPSSEQPAVITLQQWTPQAVDRLLAQVVPDASALPGGQHPAAHAHPAAQAPMCEA